MVELEGDIERLLLLQAPVAGELRYALAIIRIVPELERSGDLAEHIAKRAGSGLAAQLTPTARGHARAHGHARRRALARRRRRLHRPRPDRRRGARGGRRRDRRPPHRPHQRAPRPAGCPPAWPPTPPSWPGSTSASATTPCTSPAASPAPSPSTARTTSAPRSGRLSPWHTRLPQLQPRPERHGLRARSPSPRPAGPPAPSSRCRTTSASPPRVRTDTMTVNGTVWATAALLVLVVGARRSTAGTRSTSPPTTVACPGWIFPVVLVRLRRRHRHDLQAEPGPVHRARSTPCSRAPFLGAISGLYNAAYDGIVHPGRGPHHRRVRRDAVPLRHPDHQGHREAPHGDRRRHRRRAARVHGQHGPQPLRRRGAVPARRRPHRASASAW